MKSTQTEQKSCPVTTWYVSISRASYCLLLSAGTDTSVTAFFCSLSTSTLCWLDCVELGALLFLTTFGGVSQWGLGTGSPYAAQMPLSPILQLSCNKVCNPVSCSRLLPLRMVFRICCRPLYCPLATVSSLPADRAEQLGRNRNRIRNKSPWNITNLPRENSTGNSVFRNMTQGYVSQRF